MNRTTFPTRRHRSARRPGRHCWLHRPGLIALEDRVVPSALTTVFALDPGASVLVPSANLSGYQASLVGPAHYSDQLAVQWDLGARTLNFLPAGTALTALNSGTYKPDVNGGDSAAPGNYAGYQVYIYHFGYSATYVAIRDLVATVSTPSALPLTGTGSTYSFPSAQTLTITNGFRDLAFE